MLVLMSAYSAKIYNIMFVREERKQTKEVPESELTNANEVTFADPTN